MKVIGVVVLTVMVTIAVGSLIHLYTAQPLGSEDIKRCQTALIQDGLAAPVVIRGAQVDRYSTGERLVIVEYRTSSPDHHRRNAMIIIRANVAHVVSYL